MFSWGEIILYGIYAYLGMVVLWFLARVYYGQKTRLFMKISDMTDRRIDDKLAIARNLADVSPSESAKAFKQAKVLEYKLARQRRIMFKSSIWYFNTFPIGSRKVEISSSRQGLHEIEKELKELESYFTHADTNI